MQFFVPNVNSSGGCFDFSTIELLTILLAKTAYQDCRSENGEWARMSIVALKTIFELDYYGSNCFESMRLAVLA